MAPKKKKTKEEIATDKLKREEEARLAEEERLRKEEEVRVVAEQHEQARQQLLQHYKAAEGARLQRERQDLLPFLSQLQHDRAVASQEQSAHVDWQRHLSCKPLPDPRIKSEMNDFFNSLAENGNNQLEHALEECEKCLELAQDCSMRAIEQSMSAAAMTALSSLAAGGCTCNPQQAADADIQMLLVQAEDATTAANAQAAQYLADANKLYTHVGRKMDTATAQVLQNTDRQADNKGDVLLTAQRGCLQWGVWVNTHKNPRFKLIDFGGIGMTVDIPKQLALASVAMRVQRRPGLHQHQQQQQQQQGSISEGAGAVPNTRQELFVPLGDALQVDLLALPPGARQSNGWTIQQMTGLSSSVYVVPYPIPPAGSDLSPWQPDEEPHPLTFTVTLPPNLLLPASMSVGWWDDTHNTWSQKGISGVSYNPVSRCVTFSSTHLGCLAILQDSAATLPYNSWTIRPTGGLGANQATISIQVAGQLSAPSADGYSPSTADMVINVARGTLTLAGPCLPQLSHLLGKPMPPFQLLAACEESGLRLTPGATEVTSSGLQHKNAAMEGAMCANLALLCGNFLVASSRWNRAAGPAAALCRVSEVTDWEEGGRTGVEHTARLFTREVREGERRVLVIRQQALAGVMFVDGANNRTEPPCLCDFSTVSGVEAAASEPYGHLHASMLHLLAGTHDEIADQPMCQALAATPDSLERVRATDAVFSQTMQQTLQALRLLACA